MLVNLARNRNKKPKKVVGNVIDVLAKDPRWADVVAFDTFRSTIVIRRQIPQRETDTVQTKRNEEWALEHTVRTVAWLEDEYELEVGNAMVRDAVAVVAKQNPYHPVREYFTTIDWDHVARVDSFFSRYCGADDTPYTQDVARVAFLSSVARIVTPGCKVDTVPVLEGPQGLKKSTAIQALVGAERFSDTDLDLHSKDAYQALSGIQVYELGEFDKLMLGHDAGRIKSFITSAVDRYRAPYAERPEAIPRQVTFWGTTNHEGYLRDETGGRRFLPVTVRDMNIEAIRQDRDQLWAEAYHRRLHGEQYWPDDSLREQRESQQTERYVEDSWESHVREWLDAPYERSLDALGRPIRAPVDTTTGFTLSQALAHAVDVPVAKQGKSEQMRMTAILKRCDYGRSKLHRDDGKLVRTWLPLPPRTTAVTAQRQQPKYAIEDIF